MRHFHGYGSYGRRGSYGRDAARSGKKKGKGRKKPKKNAWSMFIQANKHLSQFRKRNGMLNLKKLAAAYRKSPKARAGSTARKGGKGKRTSSFQATPAFKQRLHGLRGLINSIAARPRKPRKAGPRKPRKYSAHTKLQMVQVELKRLEQALTKAKERAKTMAQRQHLAKEARKAGKAARKAGHSARQAQQLAHAIVAGKASPINKDYFEKKAAEAKKSAEEAKAAVAKAYRESTKAGQTYGMPGDIFRDPRRKKKSKKKAAKKRSSAKRPKKRSSAKRPKKRTTRKRKGNSAALKRYWKLVRAAMNRGQSLKAARRTASKQYKKKYGRDFEADYYGRDTYDVL